MSLEVEFPSGFMKNDCDIPDENGGFNMFYRMENSKHIE